MFSKLSLCFILTASLACAGQVSTMGGYATSTTSTAPVSALDAPLVSTPNIALPGSGPAVGAPLSSTNDSRTSTGPSVYNPNYVSSVSSGAQETSFTNNAPVSGNEGFEFGIQHFVSGAPGSTNSGQSLAEIARGIRAQQHKASKAFDNESIAKLNAAGVRTGNLGPESSTAPDSTELAQASSTNNTLVAENRMPALPQSDQAETARVSPSQNSATAAQQRRRAEVPAESSTAAAPPASAPTQASAPSEHAENTAKLPQTSSYLPLILFLGALGIAGGTLYFLRR